MSLKNGINQVYGTLAEANECIDRLDAKVKKQRAEITKLINNYNNLLAKYTILKEKVRGVQKACQAATG